jgi:hypothetical protein
MIPFKVKNFTDILGMQFAIRFDTSVLELSTFTDPQSGVTYPKASSYQLDDGLGGKTSMIGLSDYQIPENKEALLVLWDDKTSNGVTLEDEATLFSVRFKIIGEPGSTGSISIGTSPTEVPPFKVVPVGESDIAEASLEASVSVINKIEVSGMVSIGGDTSKPMEDVSIHLVNGSEQQDTVTDAAGAYNLSVIPNATSMTLLATMENRFLGLDVADILVLRKHILNREMVTRKAALIASDANRDGSIDVADIVAMRKVILRKSDYYSNDADGNPDPVWRFLDAGVLDLELADLFAKVGDYEVIEFSDLSQDQSGVDFIGIKLGDANLDWEAPSSSTTQSAMGIEESASVLRLEAPIRDAEGHLKVDLYTDSAPHLLGMQFNLQWDRRVLDLDGLLAFQLPGFHSSAHSQLEPGMVRIAWDEASLNAVAIDPSRPFMSLFLKSIPGAEHGSAVRASEVMLLDESGLKHQYGATATYYYQEGSLIFQNGPLKAVQLRDGILGLEINTRDGKGYQISGSHDLRQSTWNHLGMIQGDGFSQVFEVPVSGEPQTYFKVDEVDGLPE